jgi:glycyl-tRNA synthetase beta chain
MSAELFLEIGTEEIPAGFLPQAMADLERLIRKEFEGARITFGTLRTYATPRRLALVVTEVAREQERQELSLMGPSVKVAFDGQDNPTKAAIGFARANGVEVTDLSRAQTDKGEYLFISKVVEGRPTADLLPEMLPRLISAIPFKKSMRWKDLDIRFARPMHWIVALFDGVVVPFALGNLNSGHLSQGHRFMAPATFAVTGEQGWLAECERHFVLPDPAQRQEIIAREIERVAAGRGRAHQSRSGAAGGSLLSGRVSSALCGSFEDKYLELPRELLITTMREHQRYFTLADGDGRLLPRFITVANTEPLDPEVVIRERQPAGSAGAS